MMREAVFALLDELKVDFIRCDHEPVETCEASTALLPPDLKGVRTKHLFLKNKKGDELFLVVVDETKLVDYKALAETLGLKRLEMANEEKLKQILGVGLGEVSMMSLLNDTDHQVRLVIDVAIWHEEAFDCHPNQSGIVLVIDKADWLRIFTKINVEPQILLVPAKS